MLLGSVSYLSLQGNEAAKPILYITPISEQLENKRGKVFITITASMVLAETPASMASSKRTSIFSFPSPKTLTSSASFSRSPLPSYPSPTFSESMIEKNIENAESTITKWDLNSSSIAKITSLFHNRKEAKAFLICVRDLRQAMHFLVLHHTSSEKLVLAQNLMQIAMKRLEKEFYQILSISGNQLDPESVSTHSSDGSSSFWNLDDFCSEDELKLTGESITKAEKITAITMSDLKLIADCMIGAGYGKECVKIYKLIRKSIVDEALYMLGIEQFRSSQIQKMSSEALDKMINNWLDAVKIAVKTLFSGEKLLCDHVFSASQTIRESCYFDIINGADNLFKFPALAAKSKKTPDRIFSLLRLYEALSDLQSEIELIFSSPLTSNIKVQALTSLTTLGNSVCSILSDFESSIQMNSSKTPIIGGGIHPLTRSAMNYISSFADYSSIISTILADSPRRTISLPDSYFDNCTSEDGSAPLVSVCIARIILVLQCLLDRKADAYKDVSLSYLFLANNLQFIIEKVCTSHLKAVLGEDWVLKHVKKVKQYASNYELLAWSKVFSSLPEKNSPQLSPEEAKGCFRRFSSAFEEAYMKQTSWTVPDGKLRNGLKMSIAKKLVPPYRQFCETHLGMLTGERNLEMLVRFGPDDLVNYLSDLFNDASILDISPSITSIKCLTR